MARSVKCTLVNKSKLKLTLSSVALSEGKWSTGGELASGTVIAAGDQKAWKSEAEGIIKGQAQFNVEDGSSVLVMWNYPQRPPGTWSLTHFVGSDQEEGHKFVGGTAADVDVTFEFEPKLSAAAKSAKVLGPPPAGTMNAQAKCGQTTHISPPEGSKDIMIVPKFATIDAAAEGEPGMKNGQLQKENFNWGKQWKKADDKHRDLIEVPVNGAWADFEKAMMDAAKQAKGREIILLTGHGGTSGRRGRPATEFDTIPENKGMTVHKQKISDKMLLEAPKVATFEGDIAKPIPPNNMDLVNRHEPDKYISLRKIGRQFKANGVARFTGLTCNVGLDPKFSQALADILQVEFRAYDNGVASHEELGQIQLWVTDDEDHPMASRPDHHQDKNDPTFHEIPTHLQKLFTPRC